MSESTKRSVTSGKGIKERVKRIKFTQQRLLAIAIVIILIISIIQVVSLYMFFNYKIIRIKISSNISATELSLTPEEENYNATEFKIEFKDDNNDEDVITRYIYEDGIDLKDFGVKFDAKHIVSKRVNDIKITLYIENNTETFEIKANIKVPYDSNAITLNGINFDDEEFEYENTEIPLILEALASLNPEQDIS